MQGGRISIVIPTYGRDEVLLDSLAALLPLRQEGDEILVVDQTVHHAEVAEKQLADWNTAGLIRWIRLAKPSIPIAMNVGLKQAVNSLVLFLDDDIIPSADLLEAHRRAHHQSQFLWATVGQVIQPWQVADEIFAPRRLRGLREDFDFPFHSSLDQPVKNVMAGNLCVDREKALSIGGFDENFAGSAFRFETEFARRVIRAGGQIQFVGSAGIKHLRVPSGGTRKDGSHLTSASPQHGIGDHYYAFLHGRGLEGWRYSIVRVLREVCTKFHLRHPWWIPVKMLGELRAMWGGWKMAKRMKKRQQIQVADR